MAIGRREQDSTTDVQLGSVELKNAVTDDRALVSDANTARAATDHVLSVQHLDAGGFVLPSGTTMATAPFCRVTDGTEMLLISAAGSAAMDIAEQSLTAVKISATAAANTLANPIFAQLSQDGTNAVATANPLPISATMAANAVGNPIFTSVSATAAANTLANPMFTQLSQDGTNAVAAANPLPVSATMAANTLGNPMFTQISQDGTNAVAAAYPWPISRTMAANAVGNTIFVELSDGAAAFLDNTSSPGYFRLQDGDSTVLGDVVDTHADALALSLNGLNTASFTYLYNGATMDLARAGATGELQVTDIATRPGEDAGNDWRKVKKEATKTYNPAKTTTTIDEASEIILASTEILGWPNVVLTIENTDADAFTACTVQMSPDGTTWEAWDTTTFASLGANTMKSLQISGNSRRYIKVIATATGNAGSADVWLTGNAG